MGVGYVAKNGTYPIVQFTYCPNTHKSKSTIYVICRFKLQQKIDKHFVISRGH